MELVTRKIHLKQVWKCLYRHLVKDYNQLLCFLVVNSFDGTIFNICSFLVNPSPICVLDEVDAPLDDANVTRFCGLLDELTKITNTKLL